MSLVSAVHQIEQLGTARGSEVGEEDKEVFRPGRLSSISFREMINEAPQQEPEGSLPTPEG